MAARPDPKFSVKILKKHGETVYVMLQYSSRQNPLIIQFWGESSTADQNWVERLPTFQYHFHSA